MTRCDQMKKGELYGCDHCGFEFQVTKEATHQDQLGQGACALDMTCCGDPMTLKGRGTGEPIGTTGNVIGQPVFGS